MHIKYTGTSTWSCGLEESDVVVFFVVFFLFCFFFFPIISLWQIMACPVWTPWIMDILAEPSAQIS